MGGEVSQSEILRRDREIKKLRKDKRKAEQKLQETERELRDRRKQIDILADRIDVSEIVSEQNFELSQQQISSYDLMVSIDALAKDMGLQLVFDQFEALSSGMSCGFHFRR
jgi:septal ring factor EnvC (AmiA/AmiB activator)